MKTITVYVTRPANDIDHPMDDEVNGVSDISIHPSGALILGISGESHVCYANGAWIMYTTTEDQG